MMRILFDGRELDKAGLIIKRSKADFRHAPTDAFINISVILDSRETYMPFSRIAFHFGS